MASASHYRVNLDNQSPIVVGTVDHTENQKNLVENLSKNLKINIISLNENDIDFDLIGVDASIANALRRILLAEVSFNLFEKDNVFFRINIVSGPNGCN